MRECAHCEYGNGFLIFDRLGAAKEVWRLATLWPASESTTSLPRVFRPTDSQLEASAAAARAYAPCSTDDTPPKGHFRPWALIETAEFGRAYRFVYPTLLVSGLRKAYLWDVVSATLERELGGYISSPSPSAPAPALATTSPVAPVVVPKSEILVCGLSSCIGVGAGTVVGEARFCVWTRRGGRMAGS